MRTSRGWRGRRAPVPHWGPERSRRR
jgi:hypothetical protein